MYGYDYEINVLLCLRVLKFLHMQFPDAAERVTADYGEVDEDAMYFLIDEIVWAIFHDVSFGSDEFDESSIVYFSHPSIDRLLELGLRDADRHGRPANAWRRKIQDIATFFALEPTYSVCRFSHHFSTTGVVFEMMLSPDCCEPILFANTLIDMVLYCQREVRHLEEKLMREAVIEPAREEAA